MYYPNWTRHCIFFCLKVLMYWFIRILRLPENVYNKHINDPSLDLVKSYQNRNDVQINEDVCYVISTSCNRAATGSIPWTVCRDGSSSKIWFTEGLYWQIHRPHFRKEPVTFSIFPYLSPEFFCIVYVWID